jgi:hypothetical protein
MLLPSGFLLFIINLLLYLYSVFPTSYFLLPISFPYHPLTNTKIAAPPSSI